MEEHKPQTPESSSNNQAEHIAPELEAIRKQCEDYLAGWKRAQADYQNLRREVEREKGELAKFANEQLIEALLPAMEQYDLVLAHVPDTSTLPEADRKPWENWLAGVRAVKSHWDQAAKNIGLERIRPAETFDPNEHEAAGEMASDKEPGSIQKVLQEGWKLHGKVIRPAKVILAAKVD